MSRKNPIRAGDRVLMAVRLVPNKERKGILNFESIMMDGEPSILAVGVAALLDNLATRIGSDFNAAMQLVADEHLKVAKDKQEKTHEEAHEGGLTQH